jgi:hypothetical protein
MAGYRFAEHEGAKTIGEKTAWPKKQEGKGHNQIITEPVCAGPAKNKPGFS